MIFTSPVFLFLFLPMFLGIYYATPARLKSAVIVLGSSIFYGWWRADFLLLLYMIIFYSWSVALSIEKWRGTPQARWVLTAGVVGNVLMLGYFKYWNLLIYTLFPFFSSAGQKVPPEWIGVILPIGISFFVFHAISYIIDVWRKDCPATRNLIDFAAFVMLFPHLIAGPVLRYKDLADQFKSRIHSWPLFSEGAFRFMSGFAKKILIADLVAPLADAAFALESPSATEAWLGLSAYTLQIYFDFAGYSEMAVGLALMMGFRFIENFNMPYLSSSITEFWRRWHISLSTWLRDYLYISLGGNRQGRFRTYCNLFITMVLGGIWHGANWTFLLWGAWHGALLMIERMKADFGFKKPAPRFLSSVLCLVCVMLGWVLFRAENITAAYTFYRGVVGLNDFALTDTLAWQIQKLSLVGMGVGILVVLIQPYFQKWRQTVQLSKGSIAVHSTPPITLQIVTAAFFVIAVSRMLAMNFIPFLYFQF